MVDKAKYAAELQWFLFSNNKTELSWTIYAQVFYTRLKHEPLGRLKAVFHDLENCTKLVNPLCVAGMAVVWGRWLAR